MRLEGSLRIKVEDMVFKLSQVCAWIMMKTRMYLDVCVCVCVGGDVCALRRSTDPPEEH